jgi:hypothetical protein
MQLATCNVEAYESVLTGLRKLGEQKNPTCEARRIYRAGSGFWEKRLGAVRIYFRVVDRRCAVLRVTSKAKQDETIEWLRVQGGR